MEALDSRQETLLKLTVRRYVKTAEPVSSEFLTENSGLGLSSATIRNAMADLEEMGFVQQPHTSAGRIPAELGWRYHVTHFLEKKKPEAEIISALQEAIDSVQEDAERLRRAAKALAEASMQTALVGFSAREVYYTGLTNLFSKPEFRQFAQVTTMSRVLDHLDEVMEKMFPTVDGTVKILIGEENPFGRECGALIIRAPFGNSTGILALLGPMRMDYDADAGLLEETVKVLSS
jgi:transcriptional regulator of heat shock response